MVDLLHHGRLSSVFLKVPSELFRIHTDYKETFLRGEQFANDQSTVLLEKSFRTFKNDHFRGQESWRAEGEEERECGGVAAAGDEAGVLTCTRATPPATPPLTSTVTY